MKCRHIKQACDCSVVRIWDNRKVRARLSLPSALRPGNIFSNASAVRVHVRARVLGYEGRFFEKAAASSSSGGGSGYGN